MDREYNTRAQNFYCKITREPWARKEAIIKLQEAGRDDMGWIQMVQVRAAQRKGVKVRAEFKQRLGPKNWTEFMEFQLGRKGRA